jgi:serine protease DegS
MAFRKFLYFLLQTVMAGLAVAFIYVLLVEPSLLHKGNAIIQVTETPSQTRQPAASHDEVQNGPGVGPVSYADAVAQATPAVVNIHTAKVITRRVPLLDDPLFQQLFGNRLTQTRREIQTSLGSGVLISKQGYVLTNNHVIEGADEIQVLLADGRTTEAKVVGTDADSDIAVLHINLANLPAIVIGDSKRLRVGDVAMAIGNPFGVGQTVTFGIISATGRDHLGINAFEDFIQTDAAINPGNSGGALINANGDLIGINSAIYSRSGGSQGIGFAIPINMAKNVMTQIIETGHVERGWLGIEAQDLTPQLAETFGMKNTHGVLISGVLRDGPADQAGIQPGDVITSINGKPVKDAGESMRIISNQKPDTEVELGGVRSGTAFSIRVHVIQRPAKPIANS